MISLLVKYLKTKNFHSQINAFQYAFYSHPNYPSLLAVTDSLEQQKIENVAARVPFIHTNQLPNRFITQLKRDNVDYYLVTKIENDFVIENEKGVKTIINSDALEKIWSGIVLLIEENENAVVEHSLTKSTFKFSSILLLITFISVFKYDLNITYIVFLFLSGFGLYISVEILKTYFKENKNNESKFCSVNKSFSCYSIINSKDYAFSKYVEFADLPIVFFASAFFSQILGLKVFEYFGWVSLFSFPFLVYSIYLQKNVLKKWCLLCLIISLLITSIGVLFLINFKNNTYSKHDLISLLFILLLFLSAWFLIKKVLIKSKSNLHKLNSLLRFKRNPDVFAKISAPIASRDQFELIDKIVIGNKKAKNTLRLFLSPICPHCHTAFKKSKELQLKYSEKLKLEVCFNVNINNLDNPYLVVYKTIIYLYNAQNDDYKIALDDWHDRNLSISEWENKWGVENNFVQENEQIEKQYQWCLYNDLNYAPIKIFNNRILPDVYELDELFYFFEE